MLDHARIDLAKKIKQSAIGRSNFDVSKKLSEDVELKDSRYASR